MIAVNIVSLSVCHDFTTLPWFYVTAAIIGKSLLCKICSSSCLTSHW